MDDVFVATKIKVIHANIISREPVLIVANKISLVHYESQTAFNGGVKLDITYTSMRVDGIWIEIEEKMEDFLPAHWADKLNAFMVGKKLSK